MIRALILMLAMSMPAQAETLRMAVTTSFHNSGLAEVLLPALEADTGVTVQMLVVGSGQAMRLGRAGDVDAILVHDPPSEAAFVAEGFGVARVEVMYNDFVIVGPRDDPAKVAEAGSAPDALRRALRFEAPFVTRGDDSGTHKKELALWGEVVPSGAWYRDVGAGMGAALNVASGLGAYILSDRASWLTFQNKGDLALLFEGDPALFNQYSFIAVNPARFGHVKADASARVAAWLVSDAARAVIDGYRLEGEALFTWNAR